MSSSSSLRAPRSASRFGQLFGARSQAVGDGDADGTESELSAGEAFAPARPPMRWRRPASSRSATMCAIQATITRTARDCTQNGGQITARIGIQGRVIAGPAGSPATVEIPLRVAVVQGGVQEKTITTKVYRTTVSMTEAGSVPFSLVAEDLVYPVPPAATGDSYIFYIGFDPQALTPEPKPKRREEEEVGAALAPIQTPARHVAPASFADRVSSAFARTSAMPLASRSSATWPFTDCDRMVEAAVTAALAAAARTSATAWASASAILLSAVLVRRATKSSILVLASAAMRSASALARGDDVLGLALGAGVTGLVFGEQLGGLVLEAAGVVELGLDAVAAMIERRQHGAVDAEIGEHAHQDDEGDGDPEFRFGEHRAYPFKDASTALSTDLPSGGTPVSRCTIAAAASAAMPRTLLIAASRVEAMVFSASASLTDSRSSSVLRSASDAALSFSRVSAPIACARERAAASSLS